MDSEIVYWQYVRSHYLREGTFPELAPGAVHSIAELFVVDPRVNVDLREPLLLD